MSDEIKTEETPVSARKYGWTPSLPDLRDIKFQMRFAAPLPDKVDLRPEMPPVYDQLTLGSCVANSISTLCQHARKKINKTPDLNPSRLFVYYNARYIGGTISYDAGSSIRDGMKAVARFGIGSEESWSYDIKKFKTKPPAPVYKESQKYRTTQYFSVSQDSQSLKACLAEGFTVSFGFSVYESFESAEIAKTGIVPIPHPGERIKGGHAVLLCGFEKNHYIVRNSWGSGWGDNGYCYFPQSMVENPSISSDFWSVRDFNG